MMDTGLGPLACPCNVQVNRDFHLEISRGFKSMWQGRCASLEAERPTVAEIPSCLFNSRLLRPVETRPSATMGKLTSLTSFLLLLSLSVQLADCCGAVLAGAGAIGSIVGGIAGARSLFYPVDVYPSRCKKDHFQVCIFVSVHNKSHSYLFLEGLHDDRSERSKSW